MVKKIKYEGQYYNVPDDASIDDIADAVTTYRSSQQQQPQADYSNMSPDELGNLDVGGGTAARPDYRAMSDEQLGGLEPSTPAPPQELSDAEQLANYQRANNVTAKPYSSTLDEIQRQAARTKKSLTMGAVSLGGLIDLPNQAINAVGGNLQMPSQMLERFIDRGNIKAGIDTRPRGKLEEYVDTGIEAMAGGAATGGLGALAPAASKTGQALKFLSPQTGSQLAGFAGACMGGRAGQELTENSGPVAKALVPIATSVLGGAAPSIAQAAYNTAKLPFRAVSTAKDLASTGDFNLANFTEDLIKKTKGDKSPYTHSESKVIKTMQDAGMKD